MAKRKLLIIGDLVEYAGHGTDEYKSNRKAGVVTAKKAGMIKVKWASSQAQPVWYQRSVLRKLHFNKKYINNLTKSSKMLHYSNNIKELKWK